MVDNFMTANTDSDLDSPATGAGKVRAFFATSRGRLIAGGAGIVVLMALAAVVVFVFLLGPSDSSLPPVKKAPMAASTSTATAPPVDRPVKPLSGTFAFRDIFQSTFTPVEETATASQGASATAGNGTNGEEEGAGAGTSEPNTLFLTDVTTEDGRPVASFVWNGVQFQAGEGEQLGDTPWSVEKIEGDTVTMLFGDSRVTLTVGQGLSK